MFRGANGSKQINERWFDLILGYEDVAQKCVSYLFNLSSYASRLLNIRGQGRSRKGRSNLN